MRGILERTLSSVDLRQALHPSRPCRWPSPPLPPAVLPLRAAIALQHFGYTRPTQPRRLSPSPGRNGRRREHTHVGHPEVQR
jgi:hypothetical protein